MFVVLDANAIFDNWYLTGPNIAIFEKFIRSGKATLVVPKIVRQEVINLYRKEVENKSPY